MLSLKSEWLVPFYGICISKAPKQIMSINGLAKHGALDAYLASCGTGLPKVALDGKLRFGAQIAEGMRCVALL